MLLDGQGKLLCVGSKVSHRFHPNYRNKVGKVISLEGHQFDGEQMVIVDWQDAVPSNVYPIEHHYAECLISEA